MVLQPLSLLSPGATLPEEQTSRGESAQGLRVKPTLPPGQPRDPC